jgi:lysophospholipase L1-like esterase
MRTQIRLLAAALALAAAPTVALAQTGSANFTKYVSLGDSLTAGFCSGSLIVNCQSASYPSLIFEQATGQARSAFQQPTVSAPGLPPILQLGSLIPPHIAPAPGAGQPTNLTLPRPYDNMAVPGFTLHDLLTKTQAANPQTELTDLILRRQGFTQLQQGLGLKPTFVTLWIGNNDALGAATSGTAIEGVTLTPVAQFDHDYKVVAGAILATGAKLAVATIPDVTSIPFVTTLTRFVPNPATGQPLLINGNPIPLIGVNPGDYVLLTAQTAMAQGYGIPTALGGNGQPLPGTVVLTAAEATTIGNFVNSYNQTIRGVAGSSDNVALFDANAVFAEIKDHGANVGGVTFTPQFLLGGLFSYDGVHPTAFGYAYIANQFIDAINAKFGGSIPNVDLYPFIFGGPKSKSMFDEDPAAFFYFTPEAYTNLKYAFPERAAAPHRPHHGHH